MGLELPSPVTIFVTLWVIISYLLNNWEVTKPVLGCFSRVWLFMTLWTVACLSLLSMGCSRQEFWSGLPCPPPGDLSDPEIKPMSLMFPALEVDSLPLVPHGNSDYVLCFWQSEKQNWNLETWILKSAEAASAKGVHRKGKPGTKC